MDTIQKKISTLQKKKDKLADEINLLLEKRNTELLEILKHVPSPSLDPSILVGGILYVCDQAIENPELAKQWRETGQKFRRRKTNSKPLQKAA